MRVPLGGSGSASNAHPSRFGELGPVEKGDVVGYMGETGNATGPHVHSSGIRTTVRPSIRTTSSCSSADGRSADAGRPGSRG